MRRYAVPSPGALSEAHVRVTAAILAGQEPSAEVAEAAERSAPEPVKSGPREIGGNVRPNGEVGPPRAIGPSSHAEVSEWVSRFIGEQGPPRIGSRLAFDAIEAEVNRHEQRMSVLEFSTDADTNFDDRELAPPASAVAEESAPLPPPRRPAPAPRRGSASRGRRPLDSKVSFTIAAVLGLLLAAILLVPRVRTILPSSGARPAVQDSIPRTTRTTGKEASTTRGVAGTVSSSTIVLTPSAGTAAPADTAKKITVWRGLEVASYLSADRASEEQQRLSSLTGLSGQVVQGEEDGTEIYRVVLGCYRSRSRAEKAAAWLLNEGYVTQARTMRVAAPEEIPE
jgi:hypothetical protein